ncbi:Transposase family Tnp2 protein [Ceratobasidium sp. AG-Ba]|nr:Transposase family Tnp2 protein [Ceratobasidium sp. AG-Ba]
MINTHHNGHGLGTLETTMLRGYLQKMEIIRILRQLQAIPNPTEDNQAMIQAILESMRTGPERESYRGMLDEVLAGEEDLQGHERCRLSSDPAKLKDLRNASQHWELICEHITTQLDG